MITNNKIFVIGSITVVVLLGLICYLFKGLGDNRKQEERYFADSTTTLIAGVPSDAVMLFDFKKSSQLLSLLNDTTSALYGAVGSSHIISSMLELDNYIKNSPIIFSLHYSAKNSVSLLSIVNIKSDEEASRYLKERAIDRDRYNGSNIYLLQNGVYISIHKGLLLASKSRFLVESSIRHLENNSSIKDNVQFDELFKKEGYLSGIYINHSQIGKFFSGVISYPFLKYSNFVMRFGMWSFCAIESGNRVLSLLGYCLNRGDESLYSSALLSQVAKKSDMGNILPSNTVAAFGLSLSNTKDFIRALELNREINKQMVSFVAKQRRVMAGRTTHPAEWVDSLKVEEVVAAYCKFGERSEWLNFIKVKESSGFGDMLSSIIEKEKPLNVEEYGNRGYIGSLFGGLFDNCNEEAVLKIRNWWILGPKEILSELVYSPPTNFTLAEYLEQTPVGKFFDSESNIKVVVNLKLGVDSLVKIVKPAGAELIKNFTKGYNFNYITAEMAPNKGDSKLSIRLYSKNLLSQPKAKEKKRQIEEKVFVDSTIVIPKGPFKVKDVSTKKEAYFTQLDNFKIRYSDSNMKGVWAIPFETPICGAVEQIDLYKNGRLQMLFISNDKLYLLDRLGRYVKGYPKTLRKNVVLGPKLVKLSGGAKDEFFVLNMDNTISLYSVDGEIVSGWNDINAPEFTKEIPVVKNVGGVNYILVSGVEGLFFYTKNGKYIDLSRYKKKILKDYSPEELPGGLIKVKCNDNKYYSLNLLNGDLKKM